MLSDVKPTTILIADNHRLFNEGLRTLLLQENARYKVVDQVYSGSDVVPAIRKAAPDLVLLDINLPNRSGLEIAGQVVREFPQVRVVIISMYSYGKFIEELRGIGVSGYLLKSASQQELLTCLQNVVEGKPYFEPKPGETGGALPEEDVLIKRYRLSPRELEILALLRQGLSLTEIAGRLFLMEETVRTYGKNIGYKLSIDNPAELIRFAEEHGL
ncbi:response regulator [Larkinella soli]|uniref:response regulator n=1 Tax=Larkinella soli TaxID=1770527 RepID=UPI000FFC81BC|nr:response regulator transcription factor [Larkinella soli]